jgi:hypothetical protein
MKFCKSSSVEEFQVISRFESLRDVLLAERYAEHRTRPLAYWALPTDRRLPLAFLGRLLGDLLATPFEELSATPGIGQKKIGSFLKLLERVVETDPEELKAEKQVLAGHGGPPRSDPREDFDPAGVSEVVWAQWRASVVRHGLGGEKLGRFAPSLRNMTRVIWNTPLGAYTGLTLAEIRARKTHGEKRVQAILEVFHTVHQTVNAVATQDHLVVRLVPRLIDRVETWLGRKLQTPGVPAEAEISEEFITPLLQQVRTDASLQIAQLAESRLGIHGPIGSVRQAARMMGLTRARVYQLLNEINDILQVRWPLGRHQVYQLRDKFEVESAHLETAPDLTQFRAAVELFYPGSRRGAAGPLETGASPAGSRNGRAKQVLV